MKTPFLSCLVLSAATLTPLHADPMPAARVQLSLNLSDGSKLRATPVLPALKVDQRIAGQLDLDWKAIKRIDMATAAADTSIHFVNGDRLTATVMARTLEFDSAIGRLKVPVGSIQHVDVTLIGGPCRNVALGKPVRGHDGASHGKGLAKHVTDGDPATHAKPPSSSFDYRIDLQNGTKASFTINSIVVDWGRFGDRFVGVRQKGSENWASGAWPGEYVTSYTIEYRQVNDNTWKSVHGFEGRPVDEKAANVVLIKEPSEQPGCSSESITHIQGLNLEKVAELRISAKGGHWIGLYELEAHGYQE